MRVKLLTLDRLNLLSEQATSHEELSQAVAELSAVAVTFDSHLLQQTGHVCPLDALGDSRQRELLRDDGRDADVQIVRDVSSAEPEFPDWLPVIRHEVESADEVSRLSAQWFSSGDCEFSWLHVVTPEHNAEQWASAVLTQVAAAANSGVTNDSLCIVTAVAGSAVTSDPFETLLCEAQIRVPLWLLGDQQSQRTVQLSGSFDVLQTLLPQPDGDRTVESDQPRRLPDLLNEDTSVERHLTVRYQDVSAIRTGNFLYVQQDNADTGFLSALYGKPGDVWNVHDLSREYPQLIDELAGLL